MANALLSHRQPRRGLSATPFSIASLLCILAVLWLAILPLPAHAEPLGDPGYKYGVDWDPESKTGEGSATTAGVTDLEVGDTYVCHADGTTEGTLFINPQCVASRGFFGMVANVICRVENVFGTIMGLVWCAVSSAILNPLLAFLTLYVTIYGVMVVLGLVSQTINEAIVRIVKIGIVAAIALNADVAIRVGYMFFISLTQVSVQIVFDLFTPDYVQEGTMAELIEGGYISSPTNPDESRRMYTGVEWMHSLDYTTHRIFGFFTSSGPGFFIVMLGLLIFAPPLFLLLVYLILSIFKAFATAIIGYLLALLGITFLFTVSPIFVCFALFRVTFSWFESWLKNLFSYTIQIMIVFIYLMFMVMLDIVSFFQQVGSMVRSYDYWWKFGWFFKHLSPVTLCRVKRDGEGKIIYYKFNIDGTSSDVVANSSHEGYPQCMPEYDLIKVIRERSRDPADFPPGLTPEQMDEIFRVMDDEDIQLPNNAEDDLPSGLDTIAGIFEKANEDLKIPFFELIFSTPDLMGFLLTRFFAVIILTYMFERMMKKIPHTASYLAGTGFAGRLAGGDQDPGEAAGVQNPRNFMGLETGFARFKETAFGKNDNFRPGVLGMPQRLAAGVVAGVGGMAHGMRRNMFGRLSSLGLSYDVRSEVSEDVQLKEQQRMGYFEDPGKTGTGRFPAHPGGRTGRARPFPYGSGRRSRYGR